MHRYLGYVYKRIWWSLKVYKQRRLRRTTSEVEYYIDPFVPEDGNYEVDPRLIRYIYTQNSAPMRKFDIDLVMDGDWESARSEQLIENSPLYQAAYQRFKAGKDWSETDYYAQFIENGMTGITDSKQREKLKRKLKHQLELREKLYFKMEKEGYLPQNRISEEFPNAKAVQHWGEIAIHIGREGELYLCQGRHRITYALLLDLPKVFVNIIVRHSEWVKFKEKVVSYAASNQGVVECPLYHVDLQYIPSRYKDNRFDIILNKMGCTQGKVVDLNAHWGYFCRRFEEKGFECFAFEDDVENREFLSKIKRVDNSKFKILDETPIKDRSSWDSIAAVLLLGSWIGLIEEKRSFDELLGFLTYFEIGSVFIELPEDESKPRTTKDQERLIQSLMDSGKFHERKLLGQTELGTHIFQIR